MKSCGKKYNGFHFCGEIEMGSEIPRQCDQCKIDDGDSVMKEFLDMSDMDAHHVARENDEGEGEAMSKLKMSDVFELPLRQGAHELFMLSRSCTLYAEFQEGMSGQVEGAIEAINSYDSHVEQVAKLTKDVDLLRSALAKADSWLKIDQAYHGSPLMLSINKALSETEPSN